MEALARKCKTKQLKTMNTMGILIVNSDFVSDHVFYIIPLHELTLFINITFSCSFVWFEHHAAYINVNVLYSNSSM